MILTSGISHMVSVQILSRKSRYSPHTSNAQYAYNYLLFFFTLDSVDSELHALFSL